MKREGKLDISWKLYSLIVAALIVLGIAGFGYAYGGVSPAVHGHDAGEIEGATGSSIIASVDYNDCVETELNYYATTNPWAICNDGYIAIGLLVSATAPSHADWDSGKLRCCKLVSIDGEAQPAFESHVIDWFDVSAGQTYIKDYPYDNANVMVQMFFRESATSNIIYNVDAIARVNYYHSGGYYNIDLDAKKVNIQTMSYVSESFSKQFASGQYKIVIQKI